MANWWKIGERGNVEDRRGFGPVAVGQISLTGVVLLVVVNYLLGGDLTDVLEQLYSQQTSQQIITTEEFEGEDTYEVFASTVLGSTNAYWNNVFSTSGATYTEPQLILFRQSTESACGVATSQVGPHYCPYDQHIYLDETFFDALVSELGATGGDVAEAYVIAHEVGHHVQHQLGILEQVSGHQDNEMAINMELQADCFAGLWMGSLKDAGILESGEIQEAMDAAATVGDDHIQETARGYVNPETWTHGSSEQRMEWFTKGYHTGTLEICDTFK